MQIGMPVAIVGCNSTVLVSPPWIGFWETPKFGTPCHRRDCSPSTRSPYPAIHRQNHGDKQRERSHRQSMGCASTPFADSHGPIGGDMGKATSRRRCGDRNGHQPYYATARPLSGSRRGAPPDIAPYCGTLWRYPVETAAFPPMGLRPPLKAATDLLGPDTPRF
jgi:hypothetical protein